MAVGLFPYRSLIVSNYIAQIVSNRTQYRVLQRTVMLYIVRYHRLSCTETPKGLIACIVDNTV